MPFFFSDSRRHRSPGRSSRFDREGCRGNTCEGYCDHGDLVGRMDEQRRTSYVIEIAADASDETGSRTVCHVDDTPPVRKASDRRRPACLDVANYDITLPHPFRERGRRLRASIGFEGNRMAHFANLGVSKYSRCRAGGPRDHAERNNQGSGRDDRRDRPEGAES